ncbi:DNA ligase 4 [Metarhizium anisopliae]|nr:DNA ligase 4 [Metarhizium anisopliae]
MTQEANERSLVAWFNKHGSIIPRRGPEAVAFLSCLFPERRPDRVFGLSRRRLEYIIQEAQCLGVSRLKELQRWRTSNGPDLATCAERLMAVTDCEHKGIPRVSLRELDDILDRVADLAPFSSADMRQRVDQNRGGSSGTCDVLLIAFRRLQSYEAKWLIRMLLKNHSPVCVPEELAMTRFHPLLYHLLRFQNSIHMAVKRLEETNIPHILPIAAEYSHGDLSKVFKPQVGVMIGRPDYEKARSIKHCCLLAGSRQMSIERKYDGEYCQVHIDLNSPQSCLKIFSKSGRDSTHDRVGLHRAIQDSLLLGTADCRIKKQCILEGELLVWDDDCGRIEPFHKIRKHVRRSGHLLGAGQDFPIKPNEHLMIIFYDLLLLDDRVCALEASNERRQQLQSLVRQIPGHAAIGYRKVIAFSSIDAARQVTEVFAKAITQRWEGLVLKGCDDPYISYNWTTSAIKLKKDYIPGLGDSADFVIVGGNYSAEDMQEIGIGKLWWTSFHIGCVDNKDEVRRFNVKPRFRIIDIIDRHGIPKDCMVHLNRHGYFTETAFAVSSPYFDVVLDPSRNLRPKTLFMQPFIVELVGAGFDKPSNAGYYTLRFPRLLKIHGDRSFKETTGFDELQDMARQCLEMPSNLEREEKMWIKRLQGYR